METSDSDDDKPLKVKAKAATVRTSLRVIFSSLTHTQICSRIYMYASSSHVCFIFCSMQSTPKSKKVKSETANDEPRKSKKEKEESTVYAWWEEDNKLPEGQKWRTLHHNGVLFPPSYEPHGIKLKYDGEFIFLFFWIYC
jgi:hypothetical protein